MNNLSCRMDMIREPYRALFSAGRTYAAFKRETTLPLIDHLKEHNCIIDPMSGFGTLMGLCSEKGVATFNIEYNPPTYLWSVLNNPKYSDVIIELIDNLTHRRKKRLPAIATKRAEISDSWFTETSYDIAAHLFTLISNVASNCTDNNELSAAALLPFVGRLSCYVPGSIVANVKRGGICLYDGLADDFDSYLILLRHKIAEVKLLNLTTNHEIVFGDLRSIQLDRKFSAFITSPPYPNSRDYYSMFGPENDFLCFLQRNGMIHEMEVKNPLIGCVRVSGHREKIDYSTLSSDAARSFIEYLMNYQGKKQAKDDMRVYYIPYFTNYFHNIESAYKNFTKYLTRDVEGYIVVVNNTARDKIVPVAQSIVEVFTELGLNAVIDDKYTRELAHVGSINPRVKGFKARHMEYTIRVWRQ